MPQVDHVAELRAELANSILRMRERAEIEAELRSMAGNALAASVEASSVCPVSYGAKGQKPPLERS